MKLQVFQTQPTLKFASTDGLPCDKAFGAMALVFAIPKKKSQQQRLIPFMTVLCKPMAHIWCKRRSSEQRLESETPSAIKEEGLPPNKISVSSGDD